MQDGLLTERLQKEIRNGLQQETLHAEDNQNTARVEKNPKKEGKVADSPYGAAGVVMEGLDGAEDEAEVLPSTSKKKKRRHRTRGKDLSSRRRQLHRRQQQQLDRKPARDESGHGAVSAPRAEAGTGPITLPHGDR